MSSARRLAITLAASMIALAGGATAWLTADAGAHPSAASTPPGNQPNGVNIVIHASADTNFCLEDSPAPTNPASEASISQCAVRDNQAWTFADAADGSVVIIGGARGNCLDFTGKVTSFVSMTPCTFQKAEHFFFTPSGQIESTSGKKCLQAAAATQDASVSIVKCQAGVANQVWTLTH
jgi:hypothetical protein